MNWFYQEKQPQNLTFANVLNQLDKTIDAAIYKVYIFCCLSICEKNSDSFLVTVGSKNKFVKKKNSSGLQLLFSVRYANSLDKIFLIFYTEEFQKQFNYAYF